MTTTSLFCVSMAALHATTACADYTAAVLADSPVAFWTFEDVGGMTAADQSGNGRAGIYNRVSPWVSGARGTAGDFDGTTSFVDIGSNWGGGSAATIEAWVRITDPTGDIAAIVSAEQTQFVHFQFSAPAGTSDNVYYRTGQGITPGFPPPQLQSESQPTDGAWHHYVLTYDNTSMRQYIDGVEVDSVLHGGGVLSVAADMSIGRGFLGGRHLRGQIDEVAIYDYALPADRVRAHFNAIPAPSAAVVIGLAGCVTLRRRR
ncbi:MAG: LamG domain-containing protein [Planctomycetota bacterium]